MSKIFEIARMFRDDEDGAAMIEYSILVGIIAAASILIIIGIGLWVQGRFQGLCDNMTASGQGDCTPPAAATGSGTGTP